MHLHDNRRALTDHRNIMQLARFHIMAVQQQTRRRDYDDGDTDLQ